MLCRSGRIQNPVIDLFLRAPSYVSLSSEYASVRKGLEGNVRCFSRHFWRYCINLFLNILFGFVKLYEKFWIFFCSIKTCNEELKHFRSIVREREYRFHAEWTLSWRRSLSYRNQSIDLLCKDVHSEKWVSESTTKLGWYVTKLGWFDDGLSEIYVRSVIIWCSPNWDAIFWTEILS